MKSYFISYFPLNFTYSYLWSLVSFTSYLTSWIHFCLWPLEPLLSWNRVPLCIKIANCLYLCSFPIWYPYFCETVSLTPLWSYYFPAHFYSLVKIPRHNFKVFITWCILSYLTWTPSLDSYYLPDQLFNFLHLPIYSPLLLVLWKDFSPPHNAILHSNWIILLIFYNTAETQLS